MAEAGDDGAIRPNTAKMPIMKELRVLEFLSLFICKEYLRSYDNQAIQALNKSRI